MMKDKICKPLRGKLKSSSILYISENSHPILNFINYPQAASRAPEEEQGGTATARHTGARRRQQQLRGRRQRRPGRFGSRFAGSGTQTILLTHIIFHICYCTVHIALCDYIWTRLSDMSYYLLVLVSDNHCNLHTYPTIKSTPY